MAAADVKRPAVLNDAELTKLRALETRFGDGIVLVAYDKPLEPADLRGDQLEQVKSLESAIGHVFVVAWKKPVTA